MECVKCGHPMMADKQWRKIPKADRVATGMRAHRGRGLCSACQSVAQKSGTLIDYETIYTVADAMLEDAVILVVERGMRHGPDVAAELGMSQDAFTKALRRAARAGDERAIRVRSQLPWMKEIA